MSSNKFYMMNNPSQVLVNEVTDSSEYIALKKNKSLHSTISNFYYNNKEPYRFKLGDIYSTDTLNNIRSFQNNYLLPVICPLIIDGTTSSDITTYSSPYTVINLEKKLAESPKIITFPPLNIIR
jgi:hypothetical protein